MTIIETTPQVTDPEQDLDEPIFSHWVKAKPGMTAEATITEARVFGTPVTALCGYTWVPSRDPQKHPVCQKCEEIVDFERSMR